MRRAIEALDIPPPATAEAMAAWSLAHGLALLILDQRLEFEPGVDEPMEHLALVRRAADIFMAGLQAGRLSAAVAKPAGAAPRRKP